MPEAKEAATEDKKRTKEAGRSGNGRDTAVFLSRIPRRCLALSLPLLASRVKASRKIKANKTKGHMNTIISLLISLEYNNVFVSGKRLNPATYEYLRF